MTTCYQDSHVFVNRSLTCDCLTKTKILRKLMIRTWSGPPPEWLPQFLDHIYRLKQYGWEFLLITDMDWFKDRCQEVTGIRPSFVDGSRKMGDYDPLLGEVLQQFLDAGKYDYWCHCNLDCVYGRLDRWLPDSFLNNIDIYANDPGQVCGPFTVYRNSPLVNGLFRQCPTWEDNLRDPNFRGWDELDFSRTVVQEALKGRIRFTSGFLQSHDHIDDGHKQKQEVKILKDGTLIDLVTGKEELMYHFNQTRRWPIV